MRAMDDDTRKMAMMIAAFDDEHARLRKAIEMLARSGVLLQSEVRGAAQEAVDAALKTLQPRVDQAGHTLAKLQRFSLWRAAWQHAVLVVVAVAITLLAVWAYVPPLSEIIALRAEKEQLQASVDDLHKRGAKMKIIGCGPQSRLCVLVDRAAGTFGVAGSKDDVYMIVKGY
jgi:hypothetical protein